MGDVVNLQRFNARAVALPGALASLAQQFLHNLQKLNYSVNTIKGYTVDLERFVGFCAQCHIEHVQQVSGATIDDFTGALIEGQGLAPSTAQRHRESVNALLKFALSRQLIKRNPMTDAGQIRWHREPRLAPSEAAILAMIDIIPASDPLGARDRALFRLMYVAALRVSALCSLDVYRDDPPVRCAVHPNGLVSYAAKGGGLKYSGADAQCQALLRDWLKMRGQFARSDSPPALFLTTRGTRINRSQVSAALKKWGRAAGLPGIHCHLLRHRRAGEILEKVGLREAVNTLGHANAQTTLDIYGHYATEHTRKRVVELAPVRETKTCK